MTSLKLNLIVAGVVVVLTAGFAAGLMVPRMKRVNACREQVNVMVNEIEAMQRDAGDLSELYASIVALNADIEDYRQRVPTERRFGEFLGQLSDDLKEAGIVDFVVEPQPPRPMRGVLDPGVAAITADTTVLPVKLRFEGGFQTLFQLLERVESDARLARVETMRVQTDESRPNDMTAELTVNTYYNPR